MPMNEGVPAAHGEYLVAVRFPQEHDVTGIAPRAVVTYKAELSDGGWARFGGDGALPYTERITHWMPLSEWVIANA